MDSDARKLMTIMIKKLSSLKYGYRVVVEGCYNALIGNYGIKISTSSTKEEIIDKVISILNGKKTNEEYNKIIQEAEKFFGDIMYEQAMNESGGDDQKALEILDKGFDEETIKFCMCDSVEMAFGNHLIPGFNEKIREEIHEIVDYWYNQNH